MGRRHRALIDVALASNPLSIGTLGTKAPPLAVEGLVRTERAGSAANLIEGCCASIASLAAFTGSRSAGPGCSGARPRGGGVAAKVHRRHGARGQLASGLQCQDGVLGSLEPEISDRAFSSAPFATSSVRVLILNHVAAQPTVVMAPRPLPTGASAVAAMTLRASSAIRQLVRMRMGVLPKAGQHPLQTRPGEQGSPAHARQIDRARELRLCSAARHARNCRRCAGFERQPSSATGTHR